MIALLTIRFTEPITMVMTGIYGATVLANTIMFFIPFEEAWIQPVLTVIFSIVGIGVQILLESGKRKRMHLKKAAEIRKKYSTENEVEKARAMIDNLEEEGKGHRYED